MSWSGRWGSELTLRLRRERRYCEGCGRPVPWYGVAHHVDYARRGHERDEDVELLCGRCHLLMRLLARVFRRLGFTWAGLVPWATSIRESQRALYLAVQTQAFWLEALDTPVWDADARATLLAWSSSVASRGVRFATREGALADLAGWLRSGKVAEEMMGRAA